MADNPYDQFDAAPNPYDQFDLSQKPQYGSYDVLADGTKVPTGSQAAIDARSPVAGNNFAQNALLGVGKFYTDAMLGARQLYASAADAIDPQSPTLSGLVSGQQPSRLAQLQAEAADKRQIDAPLQATGGGKVGQIAGALPFAFIPGANTYAGAAVLGGATGALQPTVQGESRLLNTGVGGSLGVAGKGVGDALGSWITQRAAQPFMGWNQKTANQALATAVGSDATALSQKVIMPNGKNAIADASDRLGSIFNQARSPDVTVNIPPQTSQVLSQAEAGLPASAKEAFWKDPQVNELMTHLQNGTATAQELGTISSKLGNTAAGEMSSKGGDRELGRALFSLQNHADDLVGQSITDPALAAAYNAARPQYRTLLMSNRPTILNSATGDVNMRNLGNYLQRTDKKGYTQGGNISDLYNAARFGQATGLGSRPSPPILQPIKWAGFHAANNPVVNAVGGTVSRLGAPVAPLIPQATEGLAVGASPYAGYGLNSLVGDFFK